MIRAADHLMELGPGAGTQGGRLLFRGHAGGVRERARRREPARIFPVTPKLEKNSAPTELDGRWLTVRGASEHNLRKPRRGVSAEGVHGRVRGFRLGQEHAGERNLGHAAAWKLNGAKTIPGRHRALEGLENF